MIAYILALIFLIAAVYALKQRNVMSIFMANKAMLSFFKADNQGLFNQNIG